MLGIGKKRPELLAAATGAGLSSAESGLSQLVREVAKHPGTLARHLSRYTVDVLCGRLGCDRPTVLRCLLQPRPMAGNFEAEVARIADRLGLERRPLAELLREADALTASLPSR